MRKVLLSLIFSFVLWTCLHDVITAVAESLRSTHSRSTQRALNPNRLHISKSHRRRLDLPGPPPPPPGGKAGKGGSTHAPSPAPSSTGTMAIPVPNDPPRSQNPVSAAPSPAETIAPSSTITTAVPSPPPKSPPPSPTPSPENPATAAPSPVETISPVEARVSLSSSPTTTITTTDAPSPVATTPSTPQVSSVTLASSPTLMQRGDLATSTSSPAPTPIAASCAAAQAGDVYTTNNSVLVNITYELLTPIGNSISEILSTLDGLFREYVAQTLVNCSLGDASDVQGIDTAVPSSFTGNPCRKIHGYNTADYFCFRLTSSLEVYLSNTTAMTAPEIRDEVWRTLRIAINGPSKGSGSTRRPLSKQNGSDNGTYVSPFINEKKGIAELYFLNNERNSISQSNGARSSGNGSSGMGKKGSAALMGIVFLVFGVLGLAWMRRDRGNGDDPSHFQKATVNSGNSYQEEEGDHDRGFYGHKTPPPHFSKPKQQQRKQHPYHPRPMSNRGEFFDESVDPIGPETPSQLSCPTTGSRSEDGMVPSASVLEAYEATPAEDGEHDIISYNYATRKYPNSSKSQDQLQTERVVAAGAIPPTPNNLGPKHQLNESDELLDEPPPFLHNIPRSARSAPSRKHKSPAASDRSSGSKGQSAGNYMSEKKFSGVSSPAAKSHVVSPEAEEKVPSLRERAAASVARTLAPYGQPSAKRFQEQRPFAVDDDESSSNKSYPSKTTNDSFSITAFLNGHCAAVQNLVTGSSGSTGKEARPRAAKNPSPTSVCVLWPDSKTPPMSKSNTFLSSVNLWTSQCDARGNGDEDNDVEPWTANTMKYISNFSPYGGNNVEDPSLSQILAKVSCGGQDDVVEDRGRSPTPIDDATNAAAARTRSRTPDLRRTPRNPPGHRLRSHAEPEPGAFRLTSKTSGSPLKLSSKRSSSPRHVTPTSTSSSSYRRHDPHRGSYQFSVYPSDTVQL